MIANYIPRIAPWEEINGVLRRCRCTILNLFHGRQWQCRYIGKIRDKVYETYSVAGFVLPHSLLKPFKYQFSIFLEDELLDKLHCYKQGWTTWKHDLWLWTWRQLSSLKPGKRYKKKTLMNELIYNCLRNTFSSQPYRLTRVCESI